MTTRIWKGKAKNVTQVNTVTIANTWAANDTITITVDGIEFVVTIGSLVTTSQVATTLYEAFNGSGSLTDTTASCSPTMAQGGAQAIPQLKEIVATVSSAVVTLTARTSGKPFTITVTETTAGTGTATGATATAATGQNFWDNADNWSGDTVPVDDDVVVFNSGAISCKYNLTTAIQPAQVIVTKGYTGTIGLPEINIDSSSYPYNEYRTKYLTFDDNSVTCTYDLAYGEGSGSGLIRISAGAGQSIFNTYGTGSRLVTGQPTILLIGTHAANVLNTPQGDVGVAFFASETSTLVAIRCGNGTTSGATVVCGSGVTLTSAVIDVHGGNLTVNSATASADVDINSNGTFTALGTGAHADIDVQNGTCNYFTSGTLTTLAVRSAGVFNKDSRAATITNAIQLYKGATLKDPNKAITASGGYKLNGCVPIDVTWNVGTDRTYAVT
jgi:hypothetical protein